MTSYKTIDIAKTGETIRGFLKKSGYQYSEDNPDEDNFEFYFSINFDEHKIKLFASLTKNNSSRIDMVSAVNFSLDHVSALRDKPEVRGVDI